MKRSGGVGRGGEGRGRGYERRSVDKKMACAALHREWTD